MMVLVKEKKAMNLKLKLYRPETNELYSCGIHDRGLPDYCGWDSINVTVKIGDEDVVLSVWASRSWKIRVNFEYRDKAYYFDDETVARMVRNNGNYHRRGAPPVLDLNFEPRFTEAKRKVLRFREALEMFGGRTLDLIGDSKIKTKETNDCTVMALMESMQIKYDKAHEMLRPYRKNRKGCSFAYVLRTYFNPVFAEIKLPKRMTLGTFVKTETRRSERYIVIVKGHALCVAEQKIYDHSIKPGRKVESVFVLREKVNGRYVR
jgi:hypothetical protein